MEKILLGAYLSILATFITAVVSIVKLVNEKESKTTDYRQSWTNSVRSSMSELIASIRLQATNHLMHSNIADEIQRLYNLDNVPEQKKDEQNSITDYQKSRLKELDKLIATTEQTILKSYALTKLHFKPNDLSFSQIENKTEELQYLLRQLQEANALNRNLLHEKINAGILELTGFSRFILKTEWENVKSGEPAFKNTKRWSFIGGVSAFSILVMSGLFMIAYFLKNDSSIMKESIANEAQTNDKTKLQEKPEKNSISQIVNLSGCNETALPLTKKHPNATHHICQTDDKLVE